MTWTGRLRTVDLEAIVSTTTCRRTQAEVRTEMGVRDSAALFLGDVAFEPWLLGRTGGVR